METHDGDLVDKILKIVLGQLSDETEFTFVGHKWPDDDVFLCWWIMKNFTHRKKFRFVFGNAGDTLSEEIKNNPYAICFDTGEGEYDQHGKGLERSCSARLLTEKLGIDNPGIKPLLEMVTAVDNAESLPPTSIHFAIEGYPRILQKNGKIDWETVLQRVFELFNMIYGQEVARIKAKEKLEKFCEWTTLPNGIKVASILWHPECREAAFEAEAHVVIWTISRNGGKHFYTGIQVNRRCNVFLDNLVANLRFQEAKIHEIQTKSGQDIRGVGRQGPWYLHDSMKLILNGSRTWTPSEDEYTKLFPRQIVGLANKILSTIPKQIVSNWNLK